MTTIECGGGPSIEQRRDFAGLKDGSQVPGYRGFIPQMKYSVGKTYGRDTFDLSTDYSHKYPVASITPQKSARPPLQNELPKSTGDNKYTEEMIPGYTGYIPRWPFKFGGTYKEDCDVCIDEHLGNIKKYYNKDEDLRHSARAFPKLQPIKFDPTVRDHLNTYRETHPERGVMLDDKKGATEPPMPGYRGYVPRIHTTELGLGCRYHEMTKKGLEAFKAETEHHAAAQKAPITINRTPGAVKGMSQSMYNKRLYIHDGMIPKYTGYIPQRKYNFGNTYGNTTRSLEVCGHKENCFGDYIVTKRRPVLQSAAY